MKTATPTAAKRSPRTLAGTVPVVADGSRAQALSLYEAAIRLMQDGKFDKAHAAFNELLLVSPPDFADRIRMYTSACLQQVTKGKTQFLSHEEQYDFAISQLNHGNYEDARHEFKQIIAANPTADYAFYGLAVLASMTGEPGSCLEHLTEAIRLNPKNRIQARADSDFQDMADDPNFTELLYPDF